MYHLIIKGYDSEGPQQFDLYIEEEDLNTTIPVALPPDGVFTMKSVKLQVFRERQNAR